MHTTVGLPSRLSPLNRLQRQRLTQVWRSAGWPCHDAIELELLAAGLLMRRLAADGRETLAVTDAGLTALAVARRQGLRALSDHDRLAHRFADHLTHMGRIVWHELLLRASVVLEPKAPDDRAAVDVSTPFDLWDPLAGCEAAHGAPPATAWRLARPDLYSVRRTSVEAYLQPQVHEVKASRADLLSDLRHAAKRASYEWLSSGCHYVYPAGVADADEIPPAWGVWVLHGPIDSGPFELLRPAAHLPCQVPFPVWMALAQAAPWRPEREGGQAELMPT